MRTFLKFKTSWDLKVPKHIWVKKIFECVKFGPKVPFWILVNLQFKNGYYKNWEFWNTIFCMFSFRQRVAWIFKVICRQVLIDGMSINWWFPQRTIWSFWANRVQNKKSPQRGKITIFPELKELECSFLFVSRHFPPHWIHL